MVRVLTQTVRCGFESHPVLHFSLLWLFKRIISFIFNIQLCILPIKGMYFDLIFLLLPKNTHVHLHKVVRRVSFSCAHKTKF